MIVGEAIIQLLEQYNVDTIFGIPGVHTLEFYRGFGAQDAVQHVQARNEMGAGFLADGYARATGKPGVLLTISGPGVTNATTPLGQAYADSIPLLLISAEIPSDQIGKGRGILHETTDLNAITRPLTSFSTCATCAENIPKLIGQAFSHFAASRPRPVHISIPIDILAQEVDENWQPVTLTQLPKAAPNLVEEAAVKIKQAKNCIILVGGGAKDCDIETLAEKSGAIVIASNAGKGILRDSHPLSLGGAICREEGRALLKSADLILAIGTELSETDSFVSELEFDCPLIRIDIDRVKMNDKYPASLAIIGEAKSAVSQLNEALKEAAPELGDKPEQVVKIKADILENLNPSEEKHVKILAQLRETLDEDALVFSDACQMTYTASFALPFEKPNCFHYASGFCTLGFAFPNAIGAKLAFPEKQIIAIAGDGGTMFTVQEFITAAEQQLPIPLILWHNDGYKQIRDDMRDANVPRIAVDGIAPDFMTLAKAMHCHGEIAQSLNHLDELLVEAFKADRPTIIQIREDADWLA